MTCLRIVAALLGAGMAGVGALLALASYERYWRWRDCFNELGRCFDPGTEDVYLEQSGGVYGGLAALFVVLGLMLLMRAWPERRGP